MPRKLKLLLVALKREEKIAKRRFEENKDASNEVSKSSRTSWSAAGEREYAEGQAEITKDYYRKVADLRIKVGEALKTSRSEVGSPGFVSTQVGGETNDFFVVDEPINIKNLRLISINSPLGAAVVGKAAGEDFSYVVNGKKMKGKVLEYG